tara:strand:- start:118 stop:351 length:234 start_codon:yes stop_codon:yes gene_type:complete
MEELLNEPEFAEIIEIEASKIEELYKFKKVKHSDLKIYVSKSGKVYYEHGSVMELRKRHDELVDILNKKGITNEKRR